MALSSPYVSAPISDSTPPTIHAAIASGTELPTERSTPPGTRKMPDPITVPTTRKNRSLRRSARESCPSLAPRAVSELVVSDGDRTSSPQTPHWSIRAHTTRKIPLQQAPRCSCSIHLDEFHIPNAVYGKQSPGVLARSFFELQRTALQQKQILIDRAERGYRPVTVLDPRFQLSSFHSQLPGRIQFSAVIVAGKLRYIFRRLHSHPGIRLRFVRAEFQHHLLAQKRNPPVRPFDSKHGRRLRDKLYTKINQRQLPVLELHPLILAFITLVDARIRLQNIGRNCAHLFFGVRTRCRNWLQNILQQNVSRAVRVDRRVGLRHIA